MRALQLEAFGRLDVVDLPNPEPAAGEVLIRVVATGICGSDIHGYTGENGRRVPGQVMGHESAGRIEALGPGVTGLTVGQAVTFNPVLIPAEDRAAYAGREQMHPGKKVIGVTQDIVSSFAQLIAVPAENVVVLPDHTPVEHGALVEPLAVSVHAVRRLGAEPDDAVLVTGGGPIGQSIVLALRMAGVSRIAVTEIEPSRRELVEKLGAVAVDAAAPDAADRVREALGGLADRALDAVGIEQTLRFALSSTRLGGTVCLVGMGAPRLMLDAFLVSTEERTIVGTFTYSAADFQDAADGIAAMPELASALISRQVPLSQGDAAFAALAAGDGTPGKVLVRLDQEA